MVPIWAVICTVLIVVLLAISIFIFVIKKRTSRAIVQPQDDAATLQGSIHEKNKHNSTSAICYFADKIEIESSDDPYYKDAGGFVSIDLDNIKKEEHSNEINYTSLPNASTSTIVTAIEEGQAATVARQVIRSASRKSRTRSMVITDESSMFTEKVPDISTYATVRRPPAHFKIKDKNVSQTISKATPYKDKTLPRNNQLQHLFNDASTGDLESNNSTIRNNKMPSRNVDTIRRMLQSSWSGHNLKSSESSSTLSSGISSIRPIASPVGSINPRLQNQQLVSLSLKANQVQRRQRPTIIGYMDGPKPTASFSSSTVQTVIPADEV
ncbi:hypothetical protein CU097_005475 [Rhizopus azygosporus]|uniref:Uncharacterized protein n=1 Tax=Rhizopus azygosporus TaxID=86630 RepID=A0A367IYL7_RHIAZ|nr:hypothetical protein CU097_005475 [Rhizopus azygosporus]